MSFKRIGMFSAMAASLAMVSALFTGGSIASANSFGPTAQGGIAIVSYNDGRDRFCVKSLAPWGMAFGLSPVRQGRGPSFTVRIDTYGQTKCVSLARAYEDTKYYYWVSNTDWPAAEGSFYS